MDFSPSEPGIKHTVILGIGAWAGFGAAQAAIPIQDLHGAVEIRRGLLYRKRNDYATKMFLMG
jgi:hypothetical protein